MLFHVYGENALPQWIAMLGVLAALILLNDCLLYTSDAADE